MTSEREFFTPRMIVQARAKRAKALLRHLRAAVRALLSGLAALKARISRAAQYHRELELLIHADDRVLADIGLTRYDVATAAQAFRGWRGRRDALQAAAARRDEAMTAAATRRDRLQRVEAPPLTPALPHAMETSNFR